MAKTLFISEVAKILGLPTLKHSRYCSAKCSTSWANSNAFSKLFENVGHKLSSEDGIVPLDAMVSDNEDDDKPQSLSESFPEEPSNVDSDTREELIEENDNNNISEDNEESSSEDSENEDSKDENES